MYLTVKPRYFKVSFHLIPFLITIPKLITVENSTNWLVIHSSKNALLLFKNIRERLICLKIVNLANPINSRFTLLVESYQISKQGHLSHSLLFSKYIKKQILKNRLPPILLTKFTKLWAGLTQTVVNSGYI